MMIIDEPFAAPELIEYLECTQEPVLLNSMAEKILERHSIKALGDEEFAACVNAGGRLICTSENAFSWIAQHIEDEAVTEAIATFKDKARIRKLLAPMYPSLEYREIPTAQLKEVCFEDFSTPFVLKPNVGYCSVGVYVVESRQQWDAALADIDENMAVWRSRYAKSALDEGSFVVESYLEGTEFAVDAFFDENGEAVVLDVLRHEYANAADTSDRCYVTGASVVREYAPGVCLVAHGGKRACWCERLPCACGGSHEQWRDYAHRVQPASFCRYLRHRGCLSCLWFPYLRLFFA